MLFITILSMIGCSKSDISNSNPYLPSQSVNVSVPLVFANDLRIAGGVYYNYTIGYGISGLVIYSVNGMDEYTSYELTCPNHPIQPDGSSILSPDPKQKTFFYCRATHLHNGEKVYYDVATWGRPINQKLQYALKPYPTKRVGDNIVIRY